MAAPDDLPPWEPRCAYCGTPLRYCEPDHLKHCNARNAEYFRSVRPVVEEKLKQQLQDKEVIKDADVKDFYELEADAGSGSFGSVCMGVRKSDKARVAIKKLNSRDDPVAENREMLIMGSCSHPNLVRMHEAFCNKSAHSDTLYMVMEPVDASFKNGGWNRRVEKNGKERDSCAELFDYIAHRGDTSDEIERAYDDARVPDKHRHKAYDPKTRLFTGYVKYTPLDLHDACQVIYQVSLALDYLHNTLHCVHRDIKPENIFLGKELFERVRLGDYGLVHVYDPEDPPDAEDAEVAKGQLQTASVGSEGYVAPEVSSGKYSYPADIHMLGATAVVILSCTMPWKKLPYNWNVPASRIWNSPGLTAVLQEVEAKLGQEKARAFRDLISNMVDRDPAKRPTAHDICTHPVILEIAGVMPEEAAMEEDLAIVRDVSAKADESGVIDAQALRDGTPAVLHPPRKEPSAQPEGPGCSACAQQ